MSVKASLRHMKVKSKDILSNGNSAFKGAMVTLALLRNRQWVKGWNGRNKWYKMRSYGRSQTRLCKALQINAVRRLDFILSVVEATADSRREVTCPIYFKIFSAMWNLHYTSPPGPISSVSSVRYSSLSSPGKVYPSFISGLRLDLPLDTVV